MTTGRLTTLLLQNWSTVANGQPPPPCFSFLMITRGAEPVGKIVFLAFPARAKTPGFAIKIVRSSGQNHALEAEYRNLRAVAPFANHGRVITPQALLSSEEDGRVVVVESVVEGVSLSEVASHNRPMSFLAPIVDWLSHLGESSARVTAPTTPAEEWSALIRAALRHASTEAERRVVDAISGRLRDVERERMPRVFEQRDMGTWNLVVSRKGTIGVLDWESSCLNGFPAWDLFYFLAQYGFMIHGASSATDRPKSFADTFFVPHGFGASALAAVRRYAHTLRLREEWLGPLFLGCWLHHTLSQVTRLGVTLSESRFWPMLALTLERECRFNFLESR